MTIRQGQYWNAQRCAGHVDETTDIMQRFFISRFAGMKNGGMYDCRNIAGTSVLSTHATGRTGDTLTGTGKPTISSLFLAEQLRVYSRELGIQGLIHNRRCWFCNKGKEWRAYAGTNPHLNHIHWERIPGMFLTLNEIKRVLIGASITGNWRFPAVRRGDRGSGVLEAQTRLRAHGFSLAADSVYGPSTESAVKTFQKLAGLTVDGVVGPVTRGRLQ